MATIFTVAASVCRKTSLVVVVRAVVRVLALVVLQSRALAALAEAVLDRAPRNVPADLALNLTAPSLVLAPNRLPPLVAPVVMRQRPRLRRPVLVPLEVVPALQLLVAQVPLAPVRPPRMARVVPALVLEVAPSRRTVSLTVEVEAEVDLALH